MYKYLFVLCSLLLLGKQAEAQSLAQSNVQVSKQAALAVQLKQAQVAVEVLQETMNKIQDKVDHPEEGLEVTAKRVSDTVGRKPQLALTRTSCSTNKNTGFCELNCTTPQYRKKTKISGIFGHIKNRYKNREKPETPRQYFDKNYKDLGDLRVLAEKVSYVSKVTEGDPVTLRNSSASVRDDFKTAGCYAKQIEYCAQYGTRRKGKAGKVTYCKSKAKKYVTTKCTAVCAAAGYLK